MTFKSNIKFNLISNQKMKKRKLSLDELTQEVELLKANECFKITGGRANALEAEITYDGGTLDEVTITPSGGGGSDSGSSYSGFYGSSSGGMDYGTGYVGGGDSSFGGGGGGSNTSSTTTISHTFNSVTYMNNILAKIEMASTAGVLTGKAGEVLTINHNILDGKYDGIDINTGGIVASIGTDGIGIGVAFNGTAYTVATKGIGGGQLIATTTEGNTVVSNSISYQNGILAELSVIFSQIDTEDISDTITSLEQWAQDVAENPVF